MQQTHAMSLYKMNLQADFKFLQILSLVSNICSHCENKYAMGRLFYSTFK